MAEITDATFKSIIKNMLNEHVNRLHILEFINSEFTDSQKTILLELVLNTDTVYIPFTKNCYVFYKPNKYDVGLFGDDDRLIDLKIYNEGRLFAKITDSDNYSNDFNPFNQKFKVSVLGHDKEGNLSAINGTADHSEIVSMTIPEEIAEVKSTFKAVKITP